MLPLLTLLAVAAFLPVSEIAYVSRQLADTFASAHRLQKVHSEPVPVTDGPLAPPAPVSGGSAVRLDHVSFTYPGRQRAALSDFSLDVPPGATLALVGPSGSGKTTLGNLLLRFWDPGTGAITLDNIDLKQYQLDHLRGRIALVAQDTYLFNTSLRANVLIARPDASEADVRQAIERAALADFIATPARRPRHQGRRARRAAIGRPAPACRHRARVPQERAGADPRRGDLASRRGKRRRKCAARSMR